MITRRHFVAYRPGDQNAPPPLHIEPLNSASQWYPAPRPIQSSGEPGPPTVGDAIAYPSLGIDPTDPTTWEGRGYRQAAGMVGRLNFDDDWRY